MLYALIAVAVVAIAFVILVATRPSEFRIERSLTMSAPPAAPFALVNDFRKWTGWSPWEKLDPALRRTYSGAPAGTGAVYAWASDNKKVGEGRMTLTDSRPNDSIGLKLEFFKPFPATNDGRFTFEPLGDRTKVTWSMTGRNNSFMCKAFCMFMDMDKLVGSDFEKGLAAMRTIVELPSAAATAAPASAAYATSVN